jgi:hypothetical protein
MSANNPPTSTREQLDQSSFDDFDIFELDEDEAQAIVSDNEYIATLMNNSSLSILHLPRVRGAFVKDHEKGLFHLFITPTFWSGVLKWTKRYRVYVCFSSVLFFTYKWSLLAA